jgi:hypothetical protein
MTMICRGDRMTDLDRLPTHAGTVPDDHAQRIADAILDLAETVRRRDAVATRRAVRAALAAAAPYGTPALLVIAAAMLPVDGKLDAWWQDNRQERRAG